MTDDERKTYNRAKAARWREKHPERSRLLGRLSQQRWRERHPVEAHAAIKANYAKHRDEYLAQRREQWALRSEDERQKVRARWALDKEQRNAQRRARRAADVEAARLRDAVRRTKPGYSEQATARTAEWVRQHPEWARALRRQVDSTRRAREREVFVEDIDPRVVVERSGGLCGICGEPVDPMSRWEVDHIMPISKGGLHAYANVQLAHRRCNRSKHNRT